MIINNIKDLNDLLELEKNNYKTKIEIANLIGISRQNFFELEKKLRNENTQVSFLYILKILKKLGYSVKVEKLN